MDGRTTGLRELDRWMTSPPGCLTPEPGTHPEEEGAAPGQDRASHSDHLCHLPHSQDCAQCLRAVWSGSQGDTPDSWLLTPNYLLLTPNYLPLTPNSRLLTPNSHRKWLAAPSSYSWATSCSPSTAVSTSWCTTWPGDTWYLTPVSDHHPDHRLQWTEDESSPQGRLPTGSVTATTWDHGDAPLIYQTCLKLTAYPALLESKHINIQHRGSACGTHRIIQFIGKLCLWYSNYNLQHTSIHFDA